MDTLFLPFNIFQMVPVLAVLPALLLAALLFMGNQLKPHRPTGLVGSCILLWLAYAIWEYRVQIWAETVTAPIRVDLLLLAPFLTIMTVWACIALFRWRKRSC